MSFVWSDYRTNLQCETLNKILYLRHNLAELEKHDEKKENVEASHPRNLSFEKVLELWAILLGGKVSRGPVITRHAEAIANAAILSRNTCVRVFFPSTSKGEKWWAGVLIEKLPGPKWKICWTDVDVQEVERVGEWDPMTTKWQIA